MLTQDASAALPHDKRQIFDTLVEEARRTITARQHADSDTIRRARKPVGDRHRIGD